MDKVGHDDDSDDERDDEFREMVTLKGSDDIESSCSSTYHEVVVTSAAYTTYRSVLIWIHSNHIKFAPLSSSRSHQTKSDNPADMGVVISKEDDTMKASPKSIYRLAHLLELPDLMQLAIDNIEARLTPSNVALEFFSEFSALYAEVRQVELDYFIDNYKAVKATGAMKLVEAQASRGVARNNFQAIMELLDRISSNQFVEEAKDPSSDQEEDEHKGNDEEEF